MMKREREEQGGYKEERLLVRGNLIKKKRKDLSLAHARPSSRLAHLTLRSCGTFRRKITNDAGRGSDGATRIDRREEKGGNSATKEAERVGRNERGRCDLRREASRVFHREIRSTLRSLFSLI